MYFLIVFQLHTGAAGAWTLWRRGPLASTWGGPGSRCSTTDLPLRMGSDRVQWSLIFLFTGFFSNHTSPGPSPSWRCLGRWFQGQDGRNKTLLTSSKPLNPFTRRTANATSSPGGACTGLWKTLLMHEPVCTDVGGHPNMFVQSSLIKACAFSCNRWVHLQTAIHQTSAPSLQAPNKLSQSDLW